MTPKNLTIRRGSRVLTDEYGAAVRLKGQCNLTGLHYQPAESAETALEVLERAAEVKPII